MQSGRTVLFRFRNKSELVNGLTISYGRLS